VLLIGRQLQVNGEVGLTLRFEVRHHDLALTPACDAEASSLLGQLIPAQLVPEDVNLTEMPNAGDIRYRNNPSAEFVDSPFLGLSLIELVEAHAAAVVRRADLRHHLCHARLRGKSENARPATDESTPVR